MPAPKKKPSQKATEREVVYIRPDEAEALRERAEDEGVSKSAIIRKALRQYLGTPVS